MCSYTGEYTVSLNCIDAILVLEKYTQSMKLMYSQCYFSKCVNKLLRYVLANSWLFY